MKRKKICSPKQVRSGLITEHPLISYWKRYQGGTAFRHGHEKYVGSKAVNRQQGNNVTHSPGMLQINPVIY